MPGKTQADHFLPCEIENLEPKRESRRQTAVILYYLAGVSFGTFSFSFRLFEFEFALIHSIQKVLFHQVGILGLCRSFQFILQRLIGFLERFPVVVGLFVKQTDNPVDIVVAVDS